MDKSVLARATEDGDSPTPGYLYGEIARMTHHSFDTCLKVQEYLIGRLKKNKPNIKYKALQVIKQICREGRQEFRREMQKHVPTVKEALQFRGPPDPLRGDEYYRRVREAAKECLDAIYDTNVNAVAGISNRIKGVGNPEAVSQSTGWFNKGSKDVNQPPQNFQGPGAYGNPPGPTGYDAPGYPSGYNGPPYPGNDTQGFGGQQYPGPPGNMPPYGSQPQNQMTGMGNPLFEEKKDTSKGFFEGLKGKVSFKSEPKVTFAGAPPGLQNAPEGWSFPTNRGPTAGAYNPNAQSTYNPNEPYRPNYPPTGGYGGPSGYSAPTGSYSDSVADTRQQQTQELRERAYEDERKKGRVGGAWDNLPTPSIAPAQQPQSRPRQEDLQQPHRAERIQNEWAQEQYNSSYVRRNSSGQPPLPQQTTGASSDGSYERGIIESLCTPGGMRAVPPKDKLDAFLKSALTLDAEVVGPILDDLLVNDAWQVVSKALTVIDGLLATNGCETFHEYFSDNYDAILKVSSESDKAAVRDRAVKILHVLGKSAPSGSLRQEAPRRSSKAASSSGATDLLGDFDTPASSNVSSFQPPSTNASAPVSLFAGLQTNVDAPQQQQQHASNVHSTVDMFGGLTLNNVKEPPVPPPAPVHHPTASFDPLLQPVPPSMGSNMHMYGQPPMNPMMNPMQYQTYQHGHVQYIQPMMVMQTQSGPMLTKPMMGSSQVIGAAMIPTGYIAKTIHEPLDEKSNFDFLKKNDSFNFVKDHMK